MRNHIIAVAAFVLIVATCRANALGADFSKEQLETEGQFVKGLKPVHGYWVNWEDVFFYAGDAKIFNEFMTVYGKFKHVQLSVVIHLGEKSAASPWDKEPRNIPADWSLYIWKTGFPLQEEGVVVSSPGSKETILTPPGKPAPTRVDVWVGNRLKLKDLVVPDTVTARPASRTEESDKEISAFIASRKPKP